MHAVVGWRQGRPVVWEERSPRSVSEPLRIFPSGRIFRLDDHVRRFVRAAGGSAEELAEACRLVVRMNSIRAGRIAMIRDAGGLAVAAVEAAAPMERYCVRGRALVAPPSDTVMHDTVTRLAREVGLEIRDGRASDGEETFLAGGADELVEVRRGPVARAFKALKDSDRWMERVDLWPEPQFAEPVA